MMNNIEEKRLKKKAETIGAKLAKLTKYSKSICFILADNSPCNFGIMTYGNFQYMRLHGVSCQMFNEGDDEIKEYQTKILLKLYPNNKKRDFIFKTNAINNYEIGFYALSDSFDADDYNYMFTDFITELYDYWSEEQKDGTLVSKHAVKKEYKSII